ncbi:MAG TPA: VCBS repeat-containing protein, partial [Candidatus Cloacimonadota bacterium]|nr:VCBS repeat-containing protein [Candidatus Cloacimonadota bacterium]
MKLANYLVLLFVITISALCAQNQMDLMNTFYGEFNGDEFGAQMIVMDYNGDGYDDLIVLSNMWNGTGVYNSEYFLGKIYFYWGGPVFDNIPDFVLEGQQQNDFTGYPTNIPGMCNAGDMNADGIEDLAITRSYDNVGGIYKSLDLYLGRAIPQPIPDYVITYPQATLFPRWLGDINNDGKADLAINGLYDVSNSTPFSYIWTDLASAPVLFRSSIYRGAFFLSGVGDVNNDGFADSFMGTPLSNSYDVKASLYYGDATASMSDSLVISEYLYQEAQINARALGDINGDGFDDFIGYSDWVYHYIWLGSSELDSIPDLQLSLNTDDHDMITFSRGARVYAVHGDLNGDGFDDFVCSDPGAHGWNGQAGVWLGGPNVNATVDLVLDPPTDWQWRNFGHSKAVGDFNGYGL